MTTEPSVPGRQEIWFHYQRRRLGFRATPVHWKGWLVLLGVLAAAVAATQLPRLFFHDQSTLTVALIVAYFVSLAVAFTVLFRVIRARGRQV